MGVSQICPDDWHLFDVGIRNELDEFFAKLSSKLDDLTSTMSLALCVLGAATNMVHLRVLGSRFMPLSSVNRILFWIALCNLGTMCSCILTYLAVFIYSTPCSQIFGQSLGQVRWFLVHVFITLYMHSVSLWLVVAMAFVRFMALRRVRLSSRWMKACRAKHIIRTILLVILPFCVGSLFMYEPEETIYQRSPGCIHENDTSRYWLKIRKFEQFPSERACTIFKAHLYVFGTGCKLLPCVLLAVLSVLLLNRLRSQAANRQRTLGSTRSPFSPRRSSQDERRRTVAIIAIVSIFLVTELPQGVLTVMSGVFTEDLYFHVYPWIGGLMDMLSLLNSSANLLILAATSSDYHQAFKSAVLRRPYRVTRQRMAGRWSRTSGYGSRFSTATVSNQLETQL